MGCRRENPAGINLDEGEFYRVPAQGSSSRVAKRTREKKKEAAWIVIMTRI